MLPVFSVSSLLKWVQWIPNKRTKTVGSTTRIAGYWMERAGTKSRWMFPWRLNAYLERLWLNYNAGDVLPGSFEAEINLRILKKQLVWVFLVSHDCLNYSIGNTSIRFIHTAVRYNDVTACWPRAVCELFSDVLECVINWPRYLNI